VWADGREVYACHGVTSVDNPLPVDRDTLFVLGSVTKTYTATALMRLVAEGRVELEAPVRRYVPELVLADERAAAEVTVLNLLNHTSGLGWDLLVDTGEGDDALAGFVAKLAELELIAPPSARASYSQAGYSLLGRVIEKVVGMTYEKAIALLVFEPLGLSHSFFAPDDVEVAITIRSMVLMDGTAFVHAGAGIVADSVPERESAEVAAKAQRELAGRVLAITLRSVRDLDIAEDATADAFLLALQTWPERGVPASVEAWLVTAARRRAIDRIRSAQAAGFTLNEIGELLALDVADDRKRARALAGARVAAIDERIEELRRARDALAGLAAACARKAGGPCPILSAFDRD